MFLPRRKKVILFERSHRLYYFIFIGVASYGALEHVPPRLPTIHHHHHLLAHKQCNTNTNCTLNCTLI